jgi:hypothetical protein
MNIIERIQAPTPRFFVKLRNISLALATLGATFLASPVALPAILLKVAAYLVVAGTAGTAVSQTVTATENHPENENHGGTAIPTP